MEATVNFLAVPDVCLANGDYPLFTAKNAALAYSIHSVTMKCLPDLDQRLPVPVFEGYDTVNMIAIGDTLYWVVDWVTATNTSNSVIYNLSYCAPSDQILTGDTMTGVFSRLPSFECKYMKDTVINDALENASYLKFNTLIDEAPIFKANMGEHAQVFWVEVTANIDLRSGSNSDLIRYGFFAFYNPDMPIYGVHRIMNHDGTYYPKLLDFIVDPEVYGIPADSIQTISVSPICPYSHTYMDDTSTSVKYVVFGTDGAGNSVFFAMSKTVEVPLYPTSSTKVNVGIVQLDREYNPSYPNRGVDSPNKSSWVSMSVSLSDMQRMCGTVSVCDEKATPLSALPTEIFTDGTTHTLNLQYKCVSDFTGLYVHVRLGDYTDKVVVLPCGHLPWIGDAWEQYRIREQATDREAASNAIENAKYEAKQQLAISAVRMAGSAVENVSILDALTGKAVAGVASAAINYGADVMQNQANVENVMRSERQTLALTEHQVKAAAGTGYQTGYGLGYVLMQCVIGYGVMIQMPSHLTTTYFNGYIKNFGYPAEGERSVTAQSGYYKGRYFPDVTGAKADRIADIFNSGFRFIEVR